MSVMREGVEEDASPTAETFVDLLDDEYVAEQQLAVMLEDPVSG